MAADAGVRSLLAFWDALAARVAKLTSLPGVAASPEMMAAGVDALKTSFAKDIVQARAALPSASSSDASGGFAKWLQVANQYARALKVEEYVATTPTKYDPSGAPVAQVAPDSKKLLTAAAIAAFLYFMFAKR